MFKHSISLTGAVLFLLSAGLVQGQVTPKPDDAARHGFLGVGVAPRAIPSAALLSAISYSAARPRRRASSPAT